MLDKPEIGETLNQRYRVEKDHPTPDSYLNYFVAQDTLLERIVIIKMAAITSNERFMQRFHHEARVLAALEHPHIVPIYDYGFFNEHPFQVQRYLMGGNVNEYFANHQDGLAASEIMRLAQQLGSALDYIHNKGLVHRNVDGNNVVLDEQYEPYLTNFALAKLNEDNRNSEVARGSHDVAADLYAFGELLYQGITGRRPLTDPQGNLEAARDFRVDLPIGVDVVLNRLLRDDPNERYTSARIAVEELNRAFYGGYSQIEGQIFISYARDDKDFVYTLAKELRRIGLDIWIDQDIQPGANWDNSVEQALSESDKLLLIASPASIISENVQDEWSYFLEQGKAVYPFIYRECELSFRLRRRQYIISSGDLLTDVAKIVDVLAGATPTSL
jgi:serine/threonine protein kinase